MSQQNDKNPQNDAVHNPDERRLVRFDYAMKYMLRSPANFDVLESLLSAVLDDKIHIQEILESEGNKKRNEEKFNRVDIRCKNSKGEVIIIEVQNTREADYVQRILFGFSQAVVRHIDLGQPYAKIPKIYSISIVYFKLGAGDDYAYHGKYQFKGLHTKDELKFTEKDKQALGINSASDPMPETYFLMVEDFNKVAKTPLEEWMRFLKDGVIDPHTKDKGLQAAREKLDILKMSRDEQDQYYRYNCDAASYLYTQEVERKLALEEGEKRGIAIGEERGIDIGKIEVAKNLKAMGMSTEIIEKSTGLTKGQIEAL